MRTFLQGIEGINSREVDPDAFTSTELGLPAGRDYFPEGSQGQFSAFPGMTPKYNRHVAGRPRENLETLARMFIRVPSCKRASRIIQGLRDKVSKDVAEACISTGRTSTAAKGYIDFFLDSIQMGHNEKVQVTEVLEDNFVAFFFGAQPPTYVFGGHLMNTVQDDWSVQMFQAYQSLFRGSQLARRGLLLYLRFDSYIVAGAVTALTQTRQAANETIVPFQLQMLVHHVHRMYDSKYGSTKLPSGAGPFFPEDADNKYRAPQSYALRPYFVENVAQDGVNTEPVTEDIVDPDAFTPAELGLEDWVEELDVDPAGVTEAAESRPLDPISTEADQDIWDNPNANMVTRSR